MTDSYFQKIQAALSASPFVAQPVISVDDRGEVWFIRADIYFIDNSLLHFRELFIGQGKLQKKTYTYHYTTTSAKMESWFFVTTMLPIFLIYRLLRITNMSGKVM